MTIFIYLATIFWSLFPNLIHVFQGGDDLINKVNEANLVVNTDLRLDSNDDGVPDGLLFGNATPNSLVDGIFSSTATQMYGYIGFRHYNQNIGDIHYHYAKIKTDAPMGKVLLGGYVGSSSNVLSNDFQFLSRITAPLVSTYNTAQIVDTRASDFTPILLDYMGVYNVSVMKLNGVKNDDGILFSDLSNEEIKLQLDSWINDFGDLSFTISKDDTYDEWFIHGFVEKTAERDFLDYLGYFFWLSAPPIVLFLTLDLIRRII